MRAPVLKHAIGRMQQLFVGLCERGLDHRQFMRIGADRLEIRVHGEKHVGGTDEAIAKPFLQRLDAPALPQKAMPPPRAEI